MYAVGRIGSYISGGLYTISGPFHVFSGAVDIVAVEQPDGSFKSSPWYVRFGKFQGVLKAKEKVVNINVNGVDANFQMYLDQRGQAYFLMEEEGEEEDSALCPSSSSDEMDGQPQKKARPVLKSKSCNYDANNSNDSMDGQLQNTRPVLKSKSCNYDTNKSNRGDQIDANNGKIVARTNSRRSRILGLVFGWRSMRKEHHQEGYDDHTVIRISSWDRAEIAANLLEVQWSMNLATSKHRKDNALLFSVSDTTDVKGVKNTLSSDEQNQIGSSPHDVVGASLDHIMSPEPTGSCNVKGGTNPQSSFGEVECPVEEISVCMQSLHTMENVIETSIIGGSILEDKSEMISDVSRNIDEPNVLCIDTAEDAISMVVTSDSQILCSSERSDEERPYEQWDVAPASFDRYREESGSDRFQAFTHCETSKRETEASSEESHETLHIANRVPAKIDFDAENLLATAKLHIEDAIYQKNETVEADMAHVEARDDCQLKNPLPFINAHDELNIEEPPTGSESYAQTVTVAPIFDSARESAQFYGDSGLTKAVSLSAFESLEDEQFLFSDLDGYKLRETQCESNLSVGVNNENHSSFCLEGIGDGSSPANRELCSSTDHSFQEDQLDGHEKFIGNLDASSGPIGVPKVHHVGGTEVERAVNSLPNMWFCTGGLNNAGLNHPLSHSLGSHSKSRDWTGDAQDTKYDTNLDTVVKNQSPWEHSDKQAAHVSGHQNGSASPGEPSTAVVASEGNWGLWPFSLKKSRSRKTMQPPLFNSKISDSERASDINIDARRDSNMPKPKGRKKIVKTNIPTSEQLALLNLKEGSNTVTFTFSTAMLGQQKVDARIYLWKWNTRIVISDVDGTITKSDVLGQFMPLVGVDWSQTGVAHLFSAIKENGYQLLFLSARAISQAYLTRQFLFNLKQDGKALPDGPVVISPDGLFPSLFREVIRRTPHEFKIACLEDIRALFPHDYNPFYAGFGNRDTDEISYLKVGVPKGKIFIINPKGEVAVNRRVATKSYTSLRTLVHDMFPPATSSEQEDFNAWNYWKLPSPLIDI